MLACDIITSEAELDALSNEWRQLQDAIGKNVFTDYDWFRTWWDNIGKKGPRSLHVVTGRENGKLVGVLPLNVTRKKGIRFLHAGGHKAFYCCDVVAENDNHALQLWEAAKASPHYDIADIRDVYSNSTGYKALSTIATPRDITGSYYVNVQAASGNDWLASLPGRTRRDHVRYMRKLEKQGPVSFEVCTTEPVPDEVIEGMIRQKMVWAETREKEGLFSGSNDNADVSAYLHQLLQTAAKQGRLMLSWLKCGPDTIAYFLWFPYRDVLRGHIVAYDPKWSHCSPGNVILALSICWGIDHGMKAIDIAQGGGSYKAKFSNEKHVCVEFTFGGSPRQKLMETLFITSRKVKRLIKGEEEEIEKADAEPSDSEEKEG